MIGKLYLKVNSIITVFLEEIVGNWALTATLRWVQVISKLLIGQIYFLNLKLNEIITVLKYIK